MIRRTTILRWLPVAALLALVATCFTAPAANATTRMACPAIYPQPAYCSDSNVILEHYDCNEGRPTLMACIPTRLAGPGYRGWVYLNLNHCPRGMACAAIYNSSTPAWSWTGHVWQKSSIAGGWVYVYPYTGSWRWAWTQASGWVALDSGRFEIRRY